MTRVQHAVRAVAVSLTALLASTTPGLALEINSSLSQSSVLVNSTTTVDGTVTVRHPGPGFADGNILTGTMPAGFVLSSVNVVPALVGGEEIWNNDDAAILVYDGSNGNELDRLPITLAGVTQTHPCGVFGVDAHPFTGEYYAFVGLMPDDGPCDYTSQRDLFRINSLTGEATWLGSPPATFNGLIFAPNGDLFGITGNGATRRSGLVKIDLTAAGAMFARSPIPGAEVTWNDPSTIGANGDDGKFYHFYLCEMATTDMTTKIQSSVVNVDNGDCPNNGLTGAGYLGNGQFIIVEWNDAYIYDVATQEWTYLTGLNDSMRGVMGAGREKTALTECTFTDATFSCTIPRFVPLGQYVIEFSGDFSPTAPGTATFDFDLNGEKATKKITMAGTDLLATASANVSRVDQTDQVTWTLEAENIGNASAANTQLVITLPSNQSYVSYATPSGSCSVAGQVLTCNAGTILAGNLARVTVKTTANADGISDVDVAVSTSSSELSTANNSATTRVVVGPAADLAVSASRPAAKEGETSGDLPGKPLPMTFAVTNLGPNDAVDAKLYHTLPANLTLTSSKPGQGTCTVAAGKLTCALGTIGVGKTVEIDVSLTASLSGSYALQVAVESLSTPDMNPANNEAFLKLDVLPPSLQVAAGKSPGSVSGEKAALAQLVLTHGGQTDQELTVKSLTFEGEFARLNLESVRVLVIEDLDGDGRADADEGVVGTGDLTVNGEAAVVKLSNDGFEIKKGETKTLLIVLRDSVGTQIASVGNGTTWAVLGLLPVALLFGLRRRTLPLAAFALFFFGATACTTDETAEEGAKIQLTLTAAEVTLADGPSPAALVEGLPLELATVEVK